LEGELNDILAGDAHPGFHLFATINPPEYSGRKPLSPALKGRFRHLPIRQYNPAELQSIAEKVLPQTLQGKIVAEKLTRQHCQLRACLKQKNLPLQPTSLDLQNVAKAVFNKGDFTDDGLHQCLNQHYRLYLMAADLSLEKLPESPALAIDKSAVHSELCEWLNQMVSGMDRPWLIRHNDHNSIDEKNHVICINTHQTKKQNKTEIITRLAQTEWQAAGLSLKPDESDDILTGALYRHWQQHWFARKFGRTGINASSVFPLTEEQKQTLKMSANQSYLQAADQRIRAWKAAEVQCWPAFWHQISDLLNHFVDDYINEASAVGGDKAPVHDLPQVHEKEASASAQRTNHEPQPVNEALIIGSDKAPEKYIPAVHMEQAPLLSHLTDYENRKKPKRVNHIIFDTQNYSSTDYRRWTGDIYVTAEGNVKCININDQHMQGVEVLIPARLPEHDQELTLAKDQTLATFEMKSRNGQYYLPSLTVNDYIVALRMEPELPFALVRDRYTGLHTLSVPESGVSQKIKFAYVAESREAGKKTCDEVVGPAQSTRFDVRCSEGMKTVLKGVLENIKQQPPEIQAPLQ
ncbi:hypothetical protein, partial [Endozoicomonas sp. SESOKO3]